MEVLMDIRKKTQFMTMTALLTAIAILIPIIMPFKIVIPPASYTLGSHIAIFIAMFLSPLMAAFVIIASSLGFLMAGFPMKPWINQRHLGFLTLFWVLFMLSLKYWLVSSSMPLQGLTLKICFMFSLS